MILLLAACDLLAMLDREPQLHLQQRARTLLEEGLAAKWSAAEVVVIRTAPLPPDPTLADADPSQLWIQVRLQADGRDQADERAAALADELATLGVQRATVTARFSPAEYQIHDARAVACRTVSIEVTNGTAMPPSLACSRALSTGVQALIDDPRVAAHLHLDDPANLPLTISTPFNLRADAEHAVAGGAFAVWQQTDGRLVLNGTDDSSSGLKLQLSIPSEGVYGTASIGGAGGIRRTYVLRSLQLVER